MCKGISERLRQQRLAIAEAIESGLDPHEVCRQFGCSVSLVHKSCSEFGVLQHGIVRKESVVRIVAELINSTATLGTIADHLDVPYGRIQSIKKLCEQHGLDVGRKVGRPRKEH